MRCRFFGFDFTFTNSVAVLFYPPFDSILRMTPLSVAVVDANELEVAVRPRLNALPRARFLPRVDSQCGSIALEPLLPFAEEKWTFRDDCYVVDTYEDVADQISLFINDVEDR